MSTHDPQRPARIELSDSDCFDFLRPKLTAMHVKCALRDELPELDAVCQHLASGFSWTPDQDPAGLPVVIARSG